MIKLENAVKMIDNAKTLGVTGNLVHLYDEDYNLPEGLDSDVKKLNRFPLDWSKAIIASGSIDSIKYLNAGKINDLTEIGITPGEYTDFKRLDNLTDSLATGGSKNLLLKLGDEDNPKGIFDRLYKRNLKYEKVARSISTAMTLLEEPLDRLIPDQDKILDILQQDFCSNLIKQFDNWDDFCESTKSITKKKMKLLNEFNNLGNVEGISKYFLTMKDNSVNWIIEHVKDGSMLKSHVIVLNDAELSQLIENYDKVSDELKALCSKDKLALVSIANNFDHESLVTGSYVDGMAPLRSGIMSYAVKHEKTVFLQNVSNNLNLIYKFLDADSLILDKVCESSLDLDTVPHSEFSMLLTTKMTDNVSLCELTSVFPWEEFKRLIGKTQQYIKFADTLKANNLFDEETFETFWDKQLLQGLDVEKLVNTMQKGDVFKRYKEVVSSGVIGLRMYLKLAQWFSDDEIARIHYSYEARIMAGHAEQCTTYQECIDAKYTEICDKWSELQDDYLIRSGLADAFAYLLEYKLGAETFTYVKEVLESVKSGAFTEKRLSIERMNWELDGKLEGSPAWLNEIGVSSDTLTARECFTTDEIIHYSTYPVTCKYSYKQLDKALSILDTTKRLVCVFKDNDCIANAVMRYSIGVENRKSEKTPVIVLGDASFASQLSARDRRLAANILIKLASVKANEVGALLCVDSGYKNEILESHLNKTKMYVYNNVSEAPVQLVQGTFSKEDWHAVKRFAKMSVYTV